MNFLRSILKIYFCCVGRGEVFEEDEEGFGDAVEGSGGGARRSCCSGS